MGHAKLTQVSASTACLYSFFSSPRNSLSTIIFARNVGAHMATSRAEPSAASSIDSIAKQFESWIENRRGVSPLYDVIVRNLIKDHDLLTLIAKAGNRPLIYNVFMGAVHYLLLENPGTKLAQLYGSIKTNPDLV